MKRILLLCLVLSGCYVNHYPQNYVFEPPRPSYQEVSAQAPAPRVIKRTVKRTVQIVPAWQLKGVVK